MFSPNSVVEEAYMTKKAQLIKASYTKNFRLNATDL